MQHEGGKARRFEDCSSRVVGACIEGSPLRQASGFGPRFSSITPSSTHWLHFSRRRCWTSRPSAPPPCHPSRRSSTRNPKHLGRLCFVKIRRAGALISAALQCSSAGGLDGRGQWPALGRCATEECHRSFSQPSVSLWRPGHGPQPDLDRVSKRRWRTPPLCLVPKRHPHANPALLPCPVHPDGRGHARPILMGGDEPWFIPIRDRRFRTQPEQCALAVRSRSPFVGCGTAVPMECQVVVWCSLSNHATPNR
jgi:hypothetical protein